MSVLGDKKVTYEDGASVDAFGRLRVSNPHTLFDSKQIYDNQPLFWDESLESGGGISAAHSAARASTIFTSTVSTAGKFTRQTFMRFNYQPGKSQLIFMTGIMNPSGGGNGVQRRIGLFDDDNGLFFEDDEGTMKVVTRSSSSGSAVDTKVASTAWNKDQLNGDGTSGVTIDWAKTQIFFFDFEWLGVGRVRFGVVIDGQPFYVHEFNNTNSLDVVYMSTPNLPLRYQMETTGVSGASTMECICASVMSEGGVAETGILHCSSTSGTHLDANVENTNYAVLGIRLKAAQLGATVSLVTAAIAEHQGNNNAEWQVVFNPTIAGSPSWSDITNSAVQEFKGATANTLSGGSIMASGFFASANKGGSSGEQLSNALLLGASIAGTRDVIVLAVRPVGGSSNLDIEGSLVWRESP